MKLTSARFIESYARLGVRFELSNGVVVASGAGVSPVFAECVARRSGELVPWIGVQEREDYGKIAEKREFPVSTHADRLIWDGIQNARRNEARVKAIVRGNRR